MGNTLYVFTLNGCEQCDELKKRLNNENISYEELEITKYEGIWNEVIKKTNQDFVPTLFIDDHDGPGQLFTPMTDYSDINEMMEIIHKNFKGE